MVGHGAKFDQKMEQAVVALLSHRSIEDAAREIGVTANTLLRWMREPEFKTACREARSTVFSHAIGRLQDAAGAAATTLLKIMLDTNVPAAIRLRAAEVVLEKASKASDTAMFELTPDVARKSSKPSAEITLMSTTTTADAAAAPSLESLQLTSGKTEEEVVEERYGRTR